MSTTLRKIHWDEISKTLFIDIKGKKEKETEDQMVLVDDELEAKNSKI